MHRATNYNLNATVISTYTQIATPSALSGKYLPDMDSTAGVRYFSLLRERIPIHLEITEGLVFTRPISVEQVYVLVNSSAKPWDLSINIGHCECEPTAPHVQIYIKHTSTEVDSGSRPFITCAL